MDLEAGIVVADHFRLDELIGRGGMGAVWRATDLSLGRTVAMKILHTDLRTDPALRERFQREARLLAAIEHPAIVPIYALSVIEDENMQCPVIIMPFVRGRTLAEAIRKQGRFSLDQALTLMRSLVDALAVAHQAGIVHRDLKPQNIVLEERGGSVQLRLLDFGIAKNVSATPTPGSVLATRAGMLLGTPEYMSPEQIRDPSTVDGRADLWAASVCFFEMLTGDVPFVGSSSVEIISKVMSRQSRSVSSLLPNVSPVVEQFFTTVFHGDLQQRPRDAAAMLALLDACGATQKPVPYAWDSSNSAPGTGTTGVKNMGVVTPVPAPLPIYIPSTLSENTNTSMPMVAEASAQPEYFGAIHYGSASMPPSKQPPQSMVHVPTSPGGATSTNSGKTLRTVAILVPVFFTLVCAVSMLLMLIFRLRH